MKLTIIIPYNGSPASLEETLVSLLENRPEKSEIIVVLNVPYENTYDLCEEEVRFAQNPEMSRSFESAVETAVKRTDGEILHIVPCGSLVSGGWADAARTLFHDDPKVTCVIPLLRKTPGLVLTQGFHFSDAGDLLPVYGETVEVQKRTENSHVPHPFGVFFRRESYAAAGGLDPSFGGTLAVVDLALKARKNGGKIVATAESSLTVPANMLYPDGPENTRRQVKRLFRRWIFAKKPLLGLCVLAAQYFPFLRKKTEVRYES